MVHVHLSQLCHVHFSQAAVFTHRGRHLFHVVQNALYCRVQCLPLASVWLLNVLLQFILGFQTLSLKQQKTLWEQRKNANLQELHPPPQKKQHFFASRTVLRECVENVILAKTEDIHLLISQDDFSDQFQTGQVRGYGCHTEKRFSKISFKASTEWPTCNCSKSWRLVCSLEGRTSSPSLLTGARRCWDEAVM